MKVCYTSDLHGRELLYQQLLELVEREQPTVLLFGGDQCPIKLKPDAAKLQEQWLCARFSQFLESVRHICRVYWTSGNNDLASTLEIIEDFQRQDLIIQTDLRWVEIGSGWSVLGFPFGPISGWIYKDWERRDIEQAAESLSPSVSYVSQNGIVEEVKTDDLIRSRPTLQVLLTDLPKPPDTTHAVLACHYPPYASELDQSVMGGSIGSKALHDYLLRSSMALACHGHVHEAPYLSGYWIRSVNGTLCLNPGQLGNQLHAVLFDTDDLEDTMIHTVFGCVDRVRIPQRSIHSIREEIEQWWRKIGALSE